MLYITFAAVVSALIFDFVNGFHDAANAIATVVGSRILKPLQAVTISSITNFVGPFIFGTAVAATIGKGIINPEFATTEVIFAGLIGAIVWNLITWYVGLPSSSSHALIGGLLGSALLSGGMQSVVVEGTIKTIIFIVVSPTMGFLTAFFLVMFLIFIFKRKRAQIVNKIFGRLQICSSIFFSLTHGANDGQKTMGVITALLVAGGFLQSDEFTVPIWVIFSAALALGLGTFFGGWRIVKTMAFKLTDLKPYQGFCAETGGGVILALMAWLGIPVSTTHAISGAIMGVGASRRLSAVRWNIGRRIIFAWIVTIPASATIAALTLFLFDFISST
ncbi:inorganic phosphate transporter [Candidatus Nitrosocosmicus franklandus]|uniref:inorganic phosphate transporter n=1 Tax=Candidatus Nitrosocosmicus franklandianus TaxID=1798806 RepID=UPI0018D554BE|nr:inorganic phosphate transporter [Candidatus Nitrosocosmicus franklandus]